MFVRVALPLGLLVLAVVVALVFDGIGATAVAIVLVGTALVAAISIVFWEVGASEDRERAQGRPGGPYDRPS
jgi:hypothetical protein